MLILEDLSAEVPDTNAFHWNLKKFSNDDNRNVLFYGYNASKNKMFFKKTEGYNRLYFNNWAPCEFAQFSVHDLNSLEYEKNFNTIYTICPYSAEWISNMKLGRKYKSIFYPFCESLIPENQEKVYDVIYHGGIHGKEHIDCLKTMSKYNYRYCTMTSYINNLTRFHLPYATNVNLKFKEKINLVAKTKISVCYNLVHVEPRHFEAIKQCRDYKKNQAFSTLGKWEVMPQFKTRMHEAAMSKTLNLVQKDEWNIAELYYEPDKEFIYFTDKKDLDRKITEVLSDWENYSKITENAYKKCMSYTTDNFIKKIKGDVNEV
jgi:predicted fused transcriptional regulator/phosphomethylpyrimidine kinase